MRRRFGNRIAFGLVTVTLMATVLVGCTSSNLGGFGTYGNNRLEVAEITNPGSYTADSALAEARAHFRNNDFGHSAALYKRAAELAPKNAEAYVGLGASYDRLGRFDLSDRVYSALYEISGATAQYYNNVGYSYMLRGNLTAALTNFRKAQRLDPDNIVVANNIQILKDAARSRA
ncbi:MAG: tetratricopeptide repeat protein [Devosia sp.]|nr:tetratricopeptide repeat protein [Devosia sp.]